MSKIYMFMYINMYVYVSVNERERENHHGEVIPNTHILVLGSDLNRP